MIASIYLKTAFFHHALPLPHSQWLKITTLALASFAMLHIQLSYPIACAIGLSCAISVIGYASEKLRGNSPAWFYLNLDKHRLLETFALQLVCCPVAVGCGAFLFGPPVQWILQEILAYDIKAIFLATVIAPWTEEIIFRGLIQEQIENIAALGLPFISEEKREWIGCAGQALLFGFCHITGAQVLGGTVEKVAVFAVSSFNGFVLGIMKIQNDSLVPSIAAHAGQNGFSILSWLALKKFILRM
jgi:membrane protease YdiL (CAAX protease family)